MLRPGRLIGLNLATKGLALPALPTLTPMLHIATDEIYTDTAMTTRATAPGAQVRAWKDKSPNGRNAIIDGASVGIPTLVASDLNGYSSVNFANDAQYNFANAITNQKPLHVFVVCRQTQGAHGSVWFGNFDSTGGYIYTSLSNAIFAPNGLETNVQFTNNVQQTYHLLEGYANTTTHGVRVNGGAGNTSASAAGVYTFNNLGQYSGTGNDAEGRLVEGIVYNRELTAPELAQVYAYFVAKYGLTIT